MGKIKFAVLLTLLSLLCFCLISCGGASFSDFRSDAFAACVEYYIGGELVFAGEADIRKACGEDSRDMTVTVSAPSAMSGTVISRESGRTRVRLSEREMESEACSFVFAATELLIPSGEAVRVEKRDVLGVRYTVAVFSTGEEMYFELGGEIPSEVRRGEERLVVRSIELRT